MTQNMTSNSGNTTDPKQGDMNKLDHDELMKVLATHMFSVYQPQIDALMRVDQSELGLIQRISETIAEGDQRIVDKTRKEDLRSLLKVQIVGLLTLVAVGVLVWLLTR